MPSLEVSISFRCGVWIMARGGQIGNKGNPNGAPRKWKSKDFGSPKIPRHLMSDVYYIAQAMDHDPELAQKIKKLIQDQI